MVIMYDYIMCSFHVVIYSNFFVLSSLLCFATPLLAVCSYRQQETLIGQEDKKWTVL